MRKLLCTGILCLACLFVFAQNGWKTLQGATSPSSHRVDDIYFINDSTGWSCASNGQIHMTRDGGESWTLQASLGEYLRSIEFSTPQKGFCGSLDSGFYKTLDGGNTWTDIRTSITPRIAGVCGISSPDPNTIYASGTWFGPAFIIKSADGGNTWKHTDMSAYANSLVDILFLNKDTGWVSGTAVNNRGIILYTENGGQTWTEAYRSAGGTPGAHEIVWKLQTPDRRHFFASIQASPGTFIRMARSTDAGKSWSTLVVKPFYRHIQVIGFINPLIGWIGGDTTLYKTIDGGETWSENLRVGDNYNRFFRVNSKLAYMTGVKVYKYNAQTDEELIHLPGFDDIHSLKVFPNPASSNLRIEAVFRNSTMANLSLFNSSGERLAVLYHGRIHADSRTFNYDIRGHAAGLYYVVLHTNEGVITRKAIKQ